MVLKVMPGSRVIHNVFGEGTVLDLLPGKKVRVRFDSSFGLPRTVVIDGLKNGKLHKDTGVPVGSRKKAGGLLEPKKVKVSSNQVLPKKAYVYQTVMEALRLGVVPAEYAHEYTVNRKKEMASLKSLYDSGQGMRLIWGEYGGGKTHLLDLAEHQALADNFLVARLVLDPIELPASHPQRLFTAFISSLRYPDRMEQGWRPLFESLKGSREHLRPDSGSFSRYFSPVLHMLDTGDEDAIAWASDYIEGYPMEMSDLKSEFRKVGWTGPDVLAMSDFRTYGRVYTRLLGTMACWARDAGFRGLVLLMDEMEFMDSLPSGLRQLAGEVLKHFAAATLDADFLHFDQNELYKGGHKVHREIDIRHKEDQPLIAIMALTPLKETSVLAGEILGEEPGIEQHLYLGEMTGKALNSLLSKIIKLYKSAYPGFKPSKTDIKGVQNWIYEEEQLGLNAIRPREAVRSMVLMLDALRYGISPFPPRDDDEFEEEDDDEEDIFTLF